MRAVIQKSKEAKVTVNKEVVGEIDSGLVILLGISNNDDEKDIDYLFEKIINLRLFTNQQKEFDLSLLETEKSALVISQFTLYAGTKKGRRPDFNQAAKSDKAKPLYEKFVEKFQEKGINIQTGNFGAMMEVHLINDGPITIIIDSPEK